MSLAVVSSAISNWIFLSMVAGVPLLGHLRKVKVFESFVEGAKSGFDIAVRIVPFLVAMLVAIGMLRASGAFALLSHALAPFLHQIGLPEDVLPMALVQPFSGSAAIGVMAGVIKTHGPDAMVSRIAATMLGSTETTFYIVAVYFGAVGIKRTRHAVPAGLIADAVGVICAAAACHMLLGG